MRVIVVILFLSHTFAIAQSRVNSETAEAILDRGKAEFKERDYEAAGSTLRKAITLNPESAEAHYFLAYAYSRINDEHGVNAMKLHWTLRVSEELEQVIQLSPKYTGEIIVLDPYSKLTSEWGCLAMCYWNANKLDSSVWAFKEGKKRGGFSEFNLALYRKTLSLCSKHSMVITSGDIPTMVMYYLQTVENYRKDVAVVNVNLLSTVWYPQMLREKSIVSFDQPKSVTDAWASVPCNDSIVSVRNKYAYKDFSWTIKKPDGTGILSRNERLLLSILKANEFESDVYFTKNFDEIYQLSLKEHSLAMILVDRININAQSNYSFPTYKTEMTKVLELLKTINTNSTDEMNAVEWLRYDLLLRLEEEHNQHHKKEAAQLLKLLDTYIPEAKFPYRSREIKNYTEHMRRQY